MTTEEQWMSFYDHAGALKAAYGAAASAPNVRGRSLKYLLDRIIDFWNEHQDTLIPFLSQLAIAALNSMVAAKASVDTVNQPGPN